MPTEELLSFVFFKIEITTGLFEGFERFAIMGQIGAVFEVQERKVLVYAEVLVKTFEIFDKIGAGLV
jgi:hypothetical protein